MRLRRVWVGVCLVLMVAACGGGEVSLTEYVERLNAIVGRASQQYYALVESPRGAVLVAEGAQLNDFTPQDLQVALEQVIEIEAEVMEAAAAIEPPKQVADLHSLWFDSDGNSTSIDEALVARAGTAANWEELSESTEMAAYRTAIARGKQVCTNFQTELDATEERGVFADTPWIPGELKEVVDGVLGCASWPEHPEDMYRPPPPNTP